MSSTNKLGDIVRPAEIEPATRLIELAHDGKIIIPLSGANINETTSLYDDRRYSVGVAAVALSYGWQVRSPLRVRRDEIFGAVAAHYGIEMPSARPVITLEPDAALKGGLEKPRTDVEYFFECIRSSAVILDLMVDHEPLIDDSIDSWVDIQRRFTRDLAEMQGSKEEKRKICTGACWKEHERILLEALMTISVPAERLDHRTLAKGGPMVQLFFHWMTERYMNQTSWQKSDLNDILHLSCAAGYADFVVTERKASGSLNRAAKALGRPENTYSTLESCVAALELRLA